MATTTTDDRLVERWVSAWAASRDLRTEAWHGRTYVHVHAPSRRAEVVCSGADDAELRRWARRVDGDPTVMVTLAAADLTGVDRRPEGLRLDRDDEVLMVLDLATVRTTPAGSPPLPCRTVWDVEGVRHTVRLIEAGTVLAEGSVGILGADSVLDEVETSPAFRRRGLARHVVTLLQARAVESGATTGLLAATDQGRPLYLGLGWQVRLQMRSYLGDAPRDREHMTT